uniref:Ubiquitin-like domain-containing protein n=1 Tax=Arion vulgaris TaxID=1028688 RepID=A0A0B7BWJ1_9EUPU
MAQQNPLPSGNAEAQANVLVTFHYEKSNGLFLQHETDCLIDALICGIKEDLQHTLGPPETQHWYYNGQLLSDDLRLKDYGVDGICNIRIAVKN